MIKILQGSAVTETVLDRLSIYRPCSCKFRIVYMCANNYESRLAVDKVIGIIIRLTFFLAHPAYMTRYFEIYVHRELCVLADCPSNGNFCQ